MALAVIFASVGTILVLVGLIGGGFEFSGSVMPKVGGVARTASLSIGGVFVLAALVVFFADLQPASTDHSTTDNSTTPNTAAAKSTGVATFKGVVMVEPGYDANLFQQPDDAADPNALPAATVTNGSTVDVTCTIEGPAMTSPVTGRTSSLWDATTTGYYIPDAAVYTGTDQPVMPSCATMA